MFYGCFQKIQQYFCIEVSYDNKKFPKWETFIKIKGKAIIILKKKLLSFKKVKFKSKYNLHKNRGIKIVALFILDFDLRT